MDRQSTTGVPAGLMRRLAALAYDLLLVLAVAFAATFAMLLLTGGEAILASTQGALGQAYRAACLLIVFAYYGGSWTRNGQTLGMNAWRIRLQLDGGGTLGWAGALLRYLLGATIGWLAI